MSMPPSVEAMKAMREVTRSTRADRYSSRSMAEPSSTKTRLTTRPAGPVWMVTSVLPSICSAVVLTSSIDLTMRTPPLSPAAASLNLPLPRPPVPGMPYARLELGRQGRHFRFARCLLCTARGDHFNFDFRTHRQGRDRERRASRIRLAHIGLVDLVDGSEISHAAQEDSRLD